MGTPEIQLSKRFCRATEWAAARHAARAHDALPVTPSLGQVLGIASLVLEDGGTEREAIAAMLLDAIGDDEVPRKELRERFGKKTAALVVRGAGARTDAGRGERRVDADTWRQRRVEALTELDRDDDPSVLRVRAADTLLELRAFVAELRRHGSIALARFPAPPNEQLEHYRTLAEIFGLRIPRTSLEQELRAAVDEMHRLVELETAIAAWRVAHIDAA
jgi:(p)ppGpp synthase/HD superfamily hydrolase